MKLLFTFLLVLMGGGWCAAQEAYFSAMKDELARTQQKLQLKDSARPYFTTYVLTETAALHAQAAWGELEKSAASAPQEPFRQVWVNMIVGSPKANSNNFQAEHAHGVPYAYAPSMGYLPSGTYAGLREGFWRVTDAEYRKALEMFSQKEAYKRKKKLKNDAQDFAPAKSARFIGPLNTTTLDKPEDINRLASALSALGKKYPHLDIARAQVIGQRTNTWYLDSQGGRWRLGHTERGVRLAAQLRNQDGYKQNFETEFSYVDAPFPPQEELLEKADKWFAFVNRFYQAKKAEPYLGPVLLAPQAAADFIDLLFVPEVSNTTALLSDSGWVSAGKFKDKLGQRVFATGFTITDRPLLSHYKGTALLGYYPVDMEGVAAQDITLVKNGKLTDLPFSRSLTAARKSGNGHARMSDGKRPRAGITNLFITPEHAYTPEELKQKLIARCKELDLEYGYRLETLPAAGDALLTRIYVKDGREEPVYGGLVQNLTTRALRDILAAGTDEKTFNESGLAARSITVPSLLVDEVELGVSDEQPDRAPYVAKPQ